MVSERLFLFVGALSSKAFAILFASSCTIIAALIGAINTNQISGALNAALAGTVPVAICLVIPRVMEQRRKSRESAAQLQKDAIELLVKAQRRDVDFYKEKIAALELAVTLHIKAKHKAVGEWDASKTAYQILHTQLRANKIEPDITITVPSYDEIVGETDDKIEAIAAARVADPPSQV